ncbi:MAG: ABC transporter permease subunit [Rhodospirillaceae bacterium]|nr:ABC transporter permease subunit [Rhodospirillaceae bacterium]
MKRRILAHVLADGLVVAVILAWWGMALSLPASVMPTPPAVAEQVWLLFTDSVYLGHTAASVARILFSVSLALLIGGALALLPANQPWTRRIVHERIKPFLNSFPSIGWAILAVIWFQVSDFTAIFVQVAILIPFCLINISEGLKELDREALEMARSFTRSRVKIFVKVTIPLLLPYIVGALRIAYGVAWKIALVSELFGTGTGIGYLMGEAQQSAKPALLYACCFAIVLIFFAGEKLVLDPLSRRVRR